MNSSLVSAALADPRLAWIKAWMPRRLKRFMLLHVFGVDMRPGAHPSRKWLEQDVLPILPKLGFKRIMFVGTAPYTWHYEAIVHKAGGEWITCDVNPSAAVWGARKHVIGRVEEIDRWFPPESFDAVILNGVLGFGVTTESELKAAARVIYRILRPKGLLLLGWNSDVIGDPLLSEIMRRLFRTAADFALPTRRSFDREAFVYDFQVRAERQPYPC
jgi:SAM-dependent methyltransferase